MKFFNFGAKRAEARAADIESPTVPVSSDAFMTFFGVQSGNLPSVTIDSALRVSDNVGKALRLSGSSAEESSGALLQLSQALGGGVVQAEEYGSLIDGLPGVLQAAAAGIKEAGGSVSALTRLVKDGKLSSKAFFDGIEAGAPLLGQRLASSVQTIDQKVIKLKNALLDAARRFNENSAAAKAFGSVIAADG